MFKVIYNDEECCEELSISGNICEYEEGGCMSQGYSQGICGLNDLKNEKGSDIPAALILKAYIDEELGAGIFDEVEIIRTRDDAIVLQYKTDFEVDKKYPRFEKFVSLLKKESREVQQLFTILNEHKLYWELQSTKKLSDNIYDAIIAALALIRKIMEKNK